MKNRFSHVVRGGGWAALTSALALMMGCGPAREQDDEAPGTQEREVVYGTDDRQDVHAHPDSTLRERARQSTVALVHPEFFDATDPDNVTFPGPTLGAARNLCTTERFFHDPRAAFCTGTLIDDDLVLTAGHCVVNAEECANTHLIFNFFRPSAGALQPVTTADVFHCSAIVAVQNGIVGGRNLDFAVIRLDPSVHAALHPGPGAQGQHRPERGAERGGHREWQRNSLQD